MQIFKFSDGYFPVATLTGAPLLRTTIKTGYAFPRRGGFVHRPVGAVAAVCDRRGLIIAARWWCKDASADVVPVPADAIQPEQRCARCDDAFLGPAVYRFFDASDRLLYIGSAQRFLIRRGDHVHAPWWPRVASEKVQRFATLVEARGAETYAIRTENPEFNQNPSGRRA